CLRCLDKDPSRRPTADDLTSVLRRFLHTESVAAGPVSPYDATPRSWAGPSAPWEQAFKWTRRRMDEIRKKLSQILERGEASHDKPSVSPEEPSHARGGFGKIWVARDSELQREVALKEVQPSRFIRRHTDVSFPSRVRRGKTY